MKLKEQTRVSTLLKLKIFFLFFSIDFAFKTTTQPQTTIYSSNSTSLYECVQSNTNDKPINPGSDKNLTNQGGNKSNEGNFSGSSYPSNNPHVKNTFDDEYGKNNYGKNYHSSNNNNSNNNNYYNNYNNNNNNNYYGKSFKKIILF